MPKNIEEIPLVSLKLNFSSGIPLYKQLYDLIRDSILEGKYMKGQRLPGTRSLASELNISRNTVALAFDQLLIEGYIRGKTGSGTYVSDIPDNFFDPVHRKTVLKESKQKKQYKIIQEFFGKSVEDLPEGYEKKKTSEEFSPIAEKFRKALGSADLISRYRNRDEIIPFQNGVPDLREFPVNSWQKIIYQTAQGFSSLPLGYEDSAGFRPLRETIASYLRKYRAVNCRADQIIIVTGTQQGLDLIGRVLLKPGSAVWLEDPGYFGARGAMVYADAEIFPSPVDNEGIDLDYSAQNNPEPDLIYTTPSHQFPLGIVMSISRRLNLLQYAYKNKCWIIEDDYDSEFRYSGSPLPSLQGMDQHKRVLYLGTFSKVLFPGLRIAYLVLPDQKTAELFAEAKSLTDRQNPVFEQAVLSKFMEEGHFTRHLRKMRMLYKNRQEFLVNEINTEFKGIIKTAVSPAGMHIILKLPKKMDDKKAAENVLKNNVIVRPLSEYSIKHFRNPGLLLGYTAFDKNQIRKGIREIRRVLLKEIR